MVTATIGDNIPLISLPWSIDHAHPRGAVPTLDNSGYVQTVDCHVHAHGL